MLGLFPITLAISRPNQARVGAGEWDRGMSVKAPRAERLKQAEVMLREGETLHYIKETLGLSFYVIQRIRNQNNIPKNKPGPSSGKTRTPEMISRMTKAWEATDSASRDEVALRFGYRNAKYMSARLYQFRKDNDQNVS
jgi:hypothetical protein